MKELNAQLTRSLRESEGFRALQAASARALESSFQNLRAGLSRPLAQHAETRAKPIEPPRHPGIAYARIAPSPELVLPEAEEVVPERPGWLRRAVKPTVAAAGFVAAVAAILEALRTFHVI